jgi:cysteine desulfurase
MGIPEGLSRYPVYMDHHATTPVDPRVVAAMLPYFTEMPGNAASIDHIYGSEANQAVEKARGQIASLINAKSREIIFTSGATESDNLAIMGVAQKYIDKGKHIITCVTEHKAVLDTCHYLEKQGWEVTYVPVDQQGLINPDDVRQAIRPDTILITIMAANNEIGVLAPLTEIGQIAREHDVFFHTDATQAVGHIPIDVQAMNVDLLSMSAHKVYGPKGIGALYVRSSRPRVGIAEQIHGGGHERNMRSGTLNVPSIVGFGKALEIAKKEMREEAVRLSELRNKLWNELRENIPDIELNGHPAIRLPHNLSIAIRDVESRLVLIHLRNDIAFSTGSACTTAKVEPSHVILSMGFREKRAYHTLRFGLGRENTLADVNFGVELLASLLVKIAQNS